MAKTLTATRQLDYGFDATGGFYVIDHFTQVAGYAYHTSDHATAAKHHPERIRDIMAAEFDRQQYLPAGVREEHYHAIVRASRVSHFVCV